MSNSQSEPSNEQTRFLKVLATILVLFGLVLIYVSFKLWVSFHLYGMSCVTGIYGFLAIGVAVYAWKLRWNLGNRTHVLGYGLLSMALLGAITVILIQPPYIWSLPLYHPKTLACIALFVNFLACARKVLASIR